MKDNSSTGPINIASAQSTVEKEYWSNQLSGDIEKTGFYRDYPVTGETAPETGFLTLQFPPDLFSHLMTLSKNSETKLFMILTAGLIGLLHKYTGSRDIIVGAPIYKQDTEGDFINTVLPIRGRVTAGISFRELLIQVRQTVIDGYKHQNFSIDTLLFELGLSLPGDEFPLFDVAVLLENIHDKNYIRHTRPGIYFSFTAADNRIELSLEYRSSLYDKRSMERIVSHYSRFLQKALSDVNIPLSHIEILSQEEKELLLFTFNSNRAVDAPGTEDKTIRRLFEEQAEKRPDHTALAVWGEAQTHGAGEKRDITYRQLNEQANRAARVLIEKGVKPDTVVCLMVDPSVQLIVGLLAILKAGGAYLPVDVETPTHRVRAILEDSAAGFLVTRKQWLDRVDFHKEVFDLDDETLYRGETEALNPANINTSSDLAYVIYTSGSTGVPKGVLIENRGLLNYVSWRLETYGQTSEDVSLALLSIAFDGFNATLYPGLLAGGKVVLVGENKIRDIDYTRKVIREEKVTTFSLTPQLYKAVVEGAKPEDLESIRFVVIGGEKANEEIIRSSSRLAPHIAFINEYGPTENSVTTTANCEMTLENLSVVGKPISNNTVFILDENLCLKPIGVPGELCVAGEGLARGYLNSPRLTSEKFQEISINGDKSPITVYRTGDLARWLPDNSGNIDLLGRMDGQVKIRGYRVELGEIEACMSHHPGITEAVAIPWEGKNDKSIYAFYVGTGESEKLSGAEIRQYLLGGLPDYMVPSYFVKLESIPRASTGKIDGKALARLAESTKVETEYTPPRTDTEKKLAAIWQDMLNLESVGVKDNFFNIGGDSIKTLTLLNVINKEFGTHFQSVDLYEDETIEKIAGKIEENKNTHVEEDKDVLKGIDDLKDRFMEGI